jgi:hypothetical protein
MDSGPDQRPPSRRLHLAAALIILGSAGLRLAYLATVCPLDLAPDEAHYWDWSRHLDWSYYSKGPLVAYVIRAACLVSGPWVEAQTGSAAAAVRLPAVVCGALLLASLYVLTCQVFRRPRWGLGVLAITLTLPPVTAGSTLMTIDAPYTCCWGWALVLGHAAVLGRRRCAWPLLGLVVGLGTLAKYTMVLFVPSLLLFLLTSTEHRRQLRGAGFWAMTALVAVSCVPLLVWNARHGWVSVRHVGAQAGLGAAAPRWLGPLAYLGVQAAVLVGFWFVAWLRAAAADWPATGREPGIRYLWWLSVPVFTVFLAFSAFTYIEPNWPAAAYLAGLVLLTGRLARDWASPRPWLRRLTRFGVASAGATGLGLSLLAYDTRPVQPVLAAVAGPPSRAHPVPLRRFDPTCRLRGWRTLAAAVDRLCAAERARGNAPLIAATSWTVPGELGFYCAGHPAVYSFGPALGERHSQYDFWRPNPVADEAAFAGRTFVVVGEPGPVLRAAFAQVDGPAAVTHTENGRPIATWRVSVCRGFRGLPVARADRRAPY